MTKKDKSIGSNQEVKRYQRLTCFLSEEELTFIDAYLKNNKIANRSKWLRETILLFIHKDLDNKYPTLFDEHEMRR
ncbi:hypothetical protein [Bacteroides propionicifaciens]|jgi:hypothetical protein|uniref:hypothetical protein n=1 Tax=Bacteroides propionicifaciens TaxID=392838 RepID=UPI00037BEE25|nr:hypothetical protein [Bacteroides propionicifaciens]